MIEVPTGLGDFRNFLFLAWKKLGLNEPDWLQYDAGHFMQTGGDRICLLCWRGFGKSWLASTFNAWELLQNPDEKVLTLSAAKKRADDTSRFILKLLHLMPELNHLIPDQRDLQRTSAYEFDVAQAQAAHAPSVRALGILSNMLTGSRGSSITVDDIETMRNSLTPGMRERVQHAFFELGGAVATPGAKIRVLGTPHLEESLYHQLEAHGYTVRIYPALYPTEEELEIYGDRLAPIIREKLDGDPKLSGQAVEPLRFDEKELRMRELEYGRTRFLLQFMLLPSLADLDRYPLRLRDMIVMDCDREVAPEKVIWGSAEELKEKGLQCVGFTSDCYYRAKEEVGELLPYKQIVMTLDPAGRGKDEFAYCIAGLQGVQVHCLALGGFLGTTNIHTMGRLAKLAKDYNVGEIVIESNFGGGAITEMLRPILLKAHPQCKLTDITHTFSQKEMRIIDTLEPVLGQHRLVMDRSVIRDDFESGKRRGDESMTYIGMFQMSRITRDRGSLVHDDRVEVLAMAVEHFMKSLGMDIETVMDLLRDDRLEQDLKEFEESVFGRQPEPMVWMARPG